MAAGVSFLPGLSECFHSGLLHKLTVEQTVQVYSGLSGTASSPCQALSFLLKISFSFSRGFISSVFIWASFLLPVCSWYAANHRTPAKTLLSIVEICQCAKNWRQILPKYLCHLFTHWFCMASSNFISVVAYNGFYLFYKLIFISESLLLLKCCVALVLMFSV